MAEGIDQDVISILSFSIFLRKSSFIK